MTLPHPHRFARLAFLSLALIFALVACGCSASSPTPRGANAEPDNAEQYYKDRLVASDEISSLLDEFEEDALDTRAASPARQPFINDNTPPPSANLSKSYEVDPAITDYTASEQHTASTINEIDAYTAQRTDPEAHRAELVRELATILRDEANSPDWPVPTLVRLAALDLIQPGTFNSYYLSDSSGSMTNLHPRDVQALSAWRDLFRNSREEFTSNAENADIASLAQRFTDQLTQQHALRVPTTALCTKVDGFGLFTELPKYDGRYKLLAGRRHRLIVYVEVDRFSHRETVQDGQSGYAVELLQDLTLYHAGDREDTLAWRKPNETITDWSRNRRRDFFVVQIIDLPETLTIGSYRLKVRMVDEGADPPAEDETVLRIDVVADVNAFKR